jgi:hypothetical protein
VNLQIVFQKLNIFKKQKRNSTFAWHQNRRITAICYTFLLNDLRHLKSPYAHFIQSQRKTTCKFSGKVFQKLYFFKSKRAFLSLLFAARSISQFWLADTLERFSDFGNKCCNLILLVIQEPLQIWEPLFSSF